jgi:hypothetical protein
MCTTEVAPRLSPHTSLARRGHGRWRPGGTRPTWTCLQRRPECTTSQCREGKWRPTRARSSHRLRRRRRASVAASRAAPRSPRTYATQNRPMAAALIAQASGWRKIAGSGDDGGRAVACHSHAHLATTSPAARPSKWARYARHARSPQREIRTTKMQAKKAGPGWRHHEERRHVGPSLPSSLIRLILLSIFSLSYLIDKIREIRLHLSYLIRP